VKLKTIKTKLFEQGQEHKIRWNRKNKYYSPDNVKEAEEALVNNEIILLL